MGMLMVMEASELFHSVSSIKKAQGWWGRGALTSKASGQPEQSKPCSLKKVLV